MSHLVELGKSIVAYTGKYAGGPPRDFERVGRDAMLVLLDNGLLPEHRVLDFGCGSLRIGYWLIRFLDPERYFGIEPFEPGVKAGLKFLIGPELEAFKKPSFRFSTDNDMAKFGVPFDFVLARSILTHTCPGMLNTMLRKFREISAPGGQFLASYWRADGPSAFDVSKVDRNQHIVVVGDDLPDDDPRFVAFALFSLDYMRDVASRYGLTVEEDCRRDTINGQIWLKFKKVDD